MSPVSPGAEAEGASPVSPGADVAGVSPALRLTALRMRRPARGVGGGGMSAHTEPTQIHQNPSSRPAARARRGPCARECAVSTGRVPDSAVEGSDEGTGPPAWPGVRRLRCLMKARSVGRPDSGLICGDMNTYRFTYIYRVLTGLLTGVLARGFGRRRTQALRHYSSTQPRPMADRAAHY